MNKMANKKEIIKWVELQINRAYEPELQDLSKEEVILECNNIIKDKLISEMVSDLIRSVYRAGGYRYEFTKNIDTTSELLNPIKTIMENIRKKEETILNSNKEIEEYNAWLKMKLAKFKEDMLLIGNRDLSDYAKTFMESIRQ